MRRILLWAVLAAGVLVALIGIGVLDVHISVRAPGTAPAQEFWTAAQGDRPLPDALALWVELARAARPAVVNVSTRARAPGTPLDEFFRRFYEGERPGVPRSSLGTGFLVSPDGYVVTNNHVVAAGGQIAVKLDRGTEHEARVVGTDPATDLALLKIDVASAPVLPFGDSDRLQVAEPVMAIGNPFGLDQTVTTGIVSAKERFIGSGPYDEFIQTDASVNPGNSGGPLIDSRGAVVGINTAIFSQTGGSVGIGFAIPINVAKAVLPQLRQRGAVVRGWLGVALRPLTPDAAQSLGTGESRGALVEGVVPGSPAERAGIRKGDVIVAFNDAPVANPADLSRRIAGQAPGERVQITTVRGGKRSTVGAELATLPERRVPPPR
jgi:serine protease Do